MATIASNPLLIKLRDNRGMVFPMAFVSLVLVILVPLPTQVLDILLCFNITLSIIVLVTTIYVTSPLEFVRLSLAAAGDDACFAWCSTSPPSA